MYYFRIYTQLIKDFFFTFYDKFINLPQFQGNSCLFYSCVQIASIVFYCMLYETKCIFVFYVFLLFVFI